MDVKYLSSVCDGGEPEVKALQKAWAVDRMSSPFALESVIFGKEGSVQSDLLRALRLIGMASSLVITGLIRD